MHIQPKPLSEYPWYLRAFYRSQQKKIGQILLPGLLWGRFPFLQILFVLFWRYLDRVNSTVDPALRSLVQVRVAQLNGCKFCIDYNSLNLLTRTNSIEKVDYLREWKTNSQFSEMERCTLEYVENVTGLHVNVPTEMMARLKLHFNDDQIVELTALIAFQNMSAKFNSALDIPSQELIH
jgi:alkylhydroperoxidase family enzyme